MPSGPDRARAFLLLALIRMYDEGQGAAKEACLAALDEAGDDAPLRAEINLHLALVCADDMVLIRRCAREARELVDQLQGAPVDLVAAALLDDAYAQFLSGDGLALEQVARADQLMPSHGNTWLAQRAHAARLSIAKYTDDLIRARELAVEVSARRRAEGNDHEAALIERHLAEIECWLGNWSRSRELTDASAQVVEQAVVPLSRSMTLYNRALLAAHTGSVTEANEAALEGLELAEEGGDLWIATLHLSVLGFLELSRGNLAEADRRLTQAASGVAEIGLAEPARFRFHGDQIEAALGLGDVERADALCDVLQRRALRAPRPWLNAISARSEALLHSARGDLDQALLAAGVALREHEHLPMPFERARTLLAKGQIERRAKRKAAARRSIEEALEIFDRLGAPLWSEIAQAELRRVGVRSSTPDGLSETERKVAELAAAGLKNREVAARLFISPKTVEANLARAYRKLGIRSRAELGATLATEGRLEGQH